MKFISYSSGYWEDQGRETVSGESLPASADSLQTPQAVQGITWRGGCVLALLSLPLLTKPPAPLPWQPINPLIHEWIDQFMRAKPSWPNHLLKTLPLNTATLGINVNVSFGRDKYANHHPLPEHILSLTSVLFSMNSYSLLKVSFFLQLCPASPTHLTQQESHKLHNLKRSFAVSWAFFLPLLLNKIIMHGL